MARWGNKFGPTRDIHLQGNISCKQVKSPDMRAGHHSGLTGWGLRISRMQGEEPGHAFFAGIFLFLHDGGGGQIPHTR